MNYPHVDEWKKAVAQHGFTVKQLQGFEQFEALDGDQVVGRWNGEGVLMIPSPPADEKPSEPPLEETAP